MSNLIIDSLPEFEPGKTFSFELACGDKIPVRWSKSFLNEAYDSVLIDRPERLTVLRKLSEYPYVFSLLRNDCLHYARQRKAVVQQWLAEGIYLFGAYKVGLKLARTAQKAGIEVKGFLDNDLAKHETFLGGVPVVLPEKSALENSVVLLASGRYSNDISKQLSVIPGIRLINMSEFLYALDAFHITESFSAFVEEPVSDCYKFVSAFLRLDDERSRLVFDRLIGMRTQLSVSLAVGAKSPYLDEYFDSDFVSPDDVRKFVDAGAATGDTLKRLESKFGVVDKAWLFEPEISSYYEALKNYCDRPEVWVFNMGLDESQSRFPYDPCLSFDVVNENNGTIPGDITSYIQGVPLDGVVPSKIGFFKLDIEGFEVSALRGARKIIARDKPVIAVCAYHRASDYWRLMDEVLSIRPDYRVGIRLYADILEDITLYFY